MASEAKHQNAGIQQLKPLAKKVKDDGFVIAINNSRLCPYERDGGECNVEFCSYNHVGSDAYNVLKAQKEKQNALKAAQRAEEAKKDLERYEKAAPKPAERPKKAVKKQPQPKQVVPQKVGNGFKFSRAAPSIRHDRYNKFKPVAKPEEPHPARFDRGPVAKNKQIVYTDDEVDDVPPLEENGEQPGQPAQEDDGADNREVEAARSGSEFGSEDEGDESYDEGDLSDASVGYLSGNEDEIFPPQEEGEEDPEPLQELKQNAPPRKVVMCKFFLQGPGKCNKGRNCTFAHGQSDYVFCSLGARCQNRNCQKQHPTARDFPPNHSGILFTSLCQDYLRDGKCRKGNRCYFAHGTDDRPCNNFFLNEEGCPYGGRCRYSHYEHYPFVEELRRYLLNVSNKQEGQQQRRRY